MRPHTGWVIRATHLAPLPESGGEQEKLEEEGTLQLLIIVMISQGIAQVLADELLLFLLFLPLYFAVFHLFPPSSHPLSFLPFLFLNVLM